MIVESSSSLHLTVSEEEESTPALAKLSSSSSSSTSSSYEDESTEDHESSMKLGEQQASSGDSSLICGQMGSSVSKEELKKVNSQCSTPVVEEEENESNSEKEGITATTTEEPNKTEQPPQLEILNSEEQADGSLHIEIKDDGCGDPEEGPSAKIQRLARKAGIIVGGGTMTAVGTVMLFLPCPTPSIYLMIGGMAIMSKEIPAAQRQLDTTRGSLQGWVERAEKEFAESVRKINVVVDNGSPKNSEQRDEKKKEEEEEVEKEENEEEEEEKKEKPTHTAITSTQVVHQQRNPVKRHFVKSCRNVILPLLNKVCTPQELLENNVVVEQESNTKTSTPEAVPEEPVKTPPTSPVASSEGKENASPVNSPFARWSQYRQNRREELLKAEEQREREAMLARINEANLKKLQEEKVVEENRDEEEDEEEEEGTPAEMSESLQRLLAVSESAVIRV